MKILITGGAGFIGSSLVEKYLADNRVSLVRIIDDFSNGYHSNIAPFAGHPKFQSIEGSISDSDLCVEITKGIDLVSHQASLGSVARSIRNPMKTTEVNVLGTVNLLHACVVNKVKRIVLASSSSVYGDDQSLPKTEPVTGAPLSPYAVTKSVMESFAHNFHRVYNLDYICLRYFNVFGPRQHYDNAYAAAIPLFCKAFIEGKQPLIYGDGETSRDFTYIDNVVAGNDLALFGSDPAILNQTYNIGCGSQVSLNQILRHLQQIAGKELSPVYAPSRKGDILHSNADISKAVRLLGYKPVVHFQEGLQKAYQWYLANYQPAAPTSVQEKSAI